METTRCAKRTLFFIFLSLFPCAIFCAWLRRKSLFVRIRSPANRFPVCSKNFQYVVRTWWGFEIVVRLSFTLGLVFVMAKWGEGDPRWIVEVRPDGTNVNNWHWYACPRQTWSQFYFIVLKKLFSLGWIGRTEKNASHWSKERLKQLLIGLTFDIDLGTLDYQAHYIFGTVDWKSCWQWAAFYFHCRKRQDDGAEPVRGGGYCQVCPCTSISM